MLGERGALFFDELVSASGLLPTHVERGLGEAVAAGRVTADGFAGLRSLLTPESRKRGGRRGGITAPGVAAGGRWSLVRPTGSEPLDAAARAIAATRALLRRYGVVFRSLVVRDSGLPPWRDLLRAMRTLEARGEIRGGRFVEGFAGEHFALPEAISPLRRARNASETPPLVSVSAADPLNLVGVVVRGRRVPATATNRVLLRDGCPIAILESDTPRFLEDVPAAEQWALEKNLRQTPAPKSLRYYA